MRRESRRPTRKTLAVVAQFEKWRKTKSGGAQIPDRLWAAAIKLCAKQSVHQVSRALRVNGTDLKRRVEGATTSANREEAGKSTNFLELDVSQLTPAPESVVELEDARGAKLRIRLRGASVDDLARVARILWGGGES